MILPTRVIRFPLVKARGNSRVLKCHIEGYCAIAFAVIVPHAPPSASLKRNRQKSINEREVLATRFRRYYIKAPPQFQFYRKTNSRDQIIMNTSVSLRLNKIIASRDCPLWTFNWN